MNTDTGSLAALEALAGALGRDEWVVVLTTHGPGRSPRLHVTSRSVPGAGSDVYAEAGWYWWPHAQRIAPACAPGQAAATITQAILRTALPKRIPPDQPGQTRRVPSDEGLAGR
ncbi:MAG TPA: hypothetical protein VGS19_01130 [Streptosporangiaceae bacterium]|nr:hypothetical protein [Streptosporangiaceae bacterium]